jgi:hypothetical protein
VAVLIASLVVTLVESAAGTAADGTGDSSEVELEEVSKWSHVLDDIFTLPVLDVPHTMPLSAHDMNPLIERLGFNKRTTLDRTQFTYSTRITTIIMFTIISLSINARFTKVITSRYTINTITILMHSNITRFTE